MQYSYICDPECFDELAANLRPVRLNVGSTVPADVTRVLLHTRDRPPLLFAARNPLGSAFDAVPLISYRLWLSREVACSC